VIGRRWPFIATGAVTLAAVAGFVLLPGIWIAVAAGVIGFAAAMVFMLVLAMPPLLAPAGDVHRLTAGITTIQYSTAFVAPVIAGAIWDATGLAASAYLLVIAAGLAMLLVPVGMRFPQLRS
jgi:CP family cyanate transporter-like MFS transporter